jgi:hypothetical protein
MTSPEPQPARQVNIGGPGPQYITQHGDVYAGEKVFSLEPFPLTRPRPDRRWLLEQPSRLLDARSQVVPFRGREPELEALREWRDRPGAVAAMLLHAPGGQGKTRLAAQFAADCAASGWQVLQARHRAALAPLGYSPLTGAPLSHGPFSHPPFSDPPFSDPPFSDAQLSGAPDRGADRSAADGGRAGPVQAGSLLVVDYGDRDR